jgi:putative transposase
MASFYWTGSHTKHRLRYHIVIMPKYRQRVLKGKIAIRLKNLFYEACQVNRWWIDEIKIMQDHVHFIIQLKPRESVSSAVQLLKGGSSKILRSEFPELKEYLWGDSFGSDGYFAETVGVVSEQVVKKYIQNQNKEIMQSE